METTTVSRNKRTQRCTFHRSANISDVRIDVNEKGTQDSMNDSVWEDDPRRHQK
jgi:hypothetical protein